MKKTLLAILTCTAALSWGQSTNETMKTLDAWLKFLPDTDRMAVEKNGEILNSGTQVKDLKWVTTGPWSADESAAWANRSTTVSAEMLTLIDTKGHSGDLSDRLLKVFNAMNAVSTMKGTQYWSTTRKDWETLILDSYRVESTEKTDRLPDATFTMIPDKSELVVFQKDNKLGDGFSQLEFKARPDGFFVTMKNLNRLTYGILPLVDPGQFQMTFSLVFLKDRVAIYTVMGAKTMQFFGLEHAKDESFHNRMKALAGWFAKLL